MEEDEKNVGGEMSIASRSYPEMEDNDKEGCSVMLHAWEKPRTAYPMPDDDVCPKCGNRGGNVFRPGKYFRCYKWCLIVDEVEFVPAMPMTDKIRYSEGITVERLELVCINCGRTFRTRTDNPRTVCQRCRNSKLSLDWQKAHPEQYAETQKKYKGVYRQKKALQRMQGIDDIACNPQMG